MEQIFCTSNKLIGTIKTEMGDLARPRPITPTTINQIRNLEEAVTPAGTIKEIIEVEEIMSSNFSYMTEMAKEHIPTRKLERQ